MDEIDEVTCLLEPLDNAMRWEVHRQLNGGQLWYQPYQMGPLPKLVDGLVQMYPLQEIRRVVRLVAGV